MVRPALLLALAWSAMADAKVSFNREIRPINPSLTRSP